MSQSNIIAGFLTLAFVVFITIKGELPIYLGFLLADPVGGGTAPSAAATPSVADKNAAMNEQNLKNAANFATTVAKIVAFPGV